jgi:hypothetical protein
MTYIRSTEENPMKIAAMVPVAVLLAAPAFAGGLFDNDDCRYTAARRAATPAAGVTRVVIHGESGFLKVDGTPGATQIGVNGTACTSDEDFLQRMTLTMRRSGSEIHIDASIPDKTVFLGFFSARLDFAVTLPVGMPVTIDDGSGWIKVANVGATRIEDGSGSIEVKNITGKLLINDDSGSIDVDAITGDVTIEDDSGEIVVRNVTGKVEIEDDSGAISVSRVASLHIRDDDSGAISAHDVKHDVLIDFDGSGAVTVADIGGNFTVNRKGSGSIDYVRVSGKVDIPERKRRD